MSNEQESQDITEQTSEKTRGLLVFLHIIFHGKLMRNLPYSHPKRQQE